MQEVTRELMIARAKELLRDGVADRVYGWKRGEFSYDVTPALFTDGDSLERDFVWNGFSAANLSKYLVSETRKPGGRVIVFMKPCDTYSLRQLLTEHRVDRDKIYVIGVPCDGMFDVNRIRERTDGFTHVEEDGDSVIIHTLFDGDMTVSRTELLPDRCIRCKSKKHVVFDELLGDDGELTVADRFDEVEKLERMTPDERFAFWQGELSRCIRCNACRDVCPACTCEKCVFDNPNSGVENKAAENSFEEKMFHIIRAFHVAGRCTDCGECSRVCPSRIPLHLLNRKFIKDINIFYGEYQAGAEVGSRAPLVDFNEDDIEPVNAVNAVNAGDAVKRGDVNA